MSLASIDLYRKHQSEFDCYQSLLLKWNEKINLTSITSPQEIIEKHFLDSLSLAADPKIGLLEENVSRETFSEAHSLLDIGSGAGFPGIPLKIVIPDLRLTLLDSVKKKCDFMKEVVRTLSLSHMDIRHQSLTAGQSVGQFDFVVTRATLPLKEFITLAASSLSPKGVMVAFKGPDVQAEVDEAEESRSRYSLQPFEFRRYELPYSKAKRVLVLTRFI